MEEKAKPEKIKEGDANALDRFVEKLKVEIKELSAQKDNLQSQILDAKVRDEREKKTEAGDVQRQIYDEEERLRIMDDNLKSRTTGIERQESGLEKREADLEKRELEVVDLDKAKAQFQQERSNFNLYKYNVEKELDEAKITIQESNVVGEKITADRQKVEADNILVTRKIKYWNDEIGKLEADKKAFQIERENVEGLKQKEVQHV